MALRWPDEIISVSKGRKFYVTTHAKLSSRRYKVSFEGRAVSLTTAGARGSSPFNHRGRHMRITGGQARGIPLTLPKGDAVRPATDALRQAVFSSLASHVVDARFLDL